MKTHRLVTRAKLTAWLQRNTRRRFKRGCENACVVACYLHENGLPQAAVFTNTMASEGGCSNYRNPAWLTEFIDAFDEGRVGAGTSLRGTGAEALRILGTKT